jgi:hypothetical protein
MIKNLRKMWDGVKTWMLLYAYLSDDKCVDKVELPMGWIRRCKHRFFTYYKIVTREVRSPIDNTDSVMFEAAYVESLLPAVYMWAGFKLLLTTDGLYVYTRGGADIVVSNAITDLAAYVSAKIRRHSVARDKQRYREQRRQELKLKYNYTVTA